MRQREVAALDGFRVRRFHLREIVHEHEFAEVIAQRRARKVPGRADEAAVGQRLAPDFLMHRGARRPRRAPFVPERNAAGHFLEIREWHTARDKTRRPSAQGDFDTLVFCRSIHY
jgi:hypothetical protein